MILLAVRWEESMWSNLKMDEIVYELTAPLEGTGNSMISGFILKAVVPAAAVMLAAIIICAVMKALRVRRYSAVAGTGALVMFLVGLVPAILFANKVGFWKWLKNQNTDSAFIEEHYVDPTKVEITFPEQKRNLIYIYLESMEVTFADKANGGGFDVNVIPELTALARENEDFSGSDAALNGGYALPGTTWTMGAMFGMTSGLPLQTKLDDNAMNTQTEFFPGITALGDILENEGYNQTLMIGSNGAFGGRELYFTTHGSYDMRDYNYCRRNNMIPEGYNVWWGFEDEKLFAFAKEWLSDSANTSEPFNFTMLTADTHFPDGYVCPLCGDTFDDQYSNVMLCSDHQVTEFVRWIQKQPFYANTTIVLVGDHPTMDVDFCDDVAADYTRKTYTTFINSAAVPEQEDLRRDYSTFDMFPTTLASIGVGIEGDRLGLGTNLYSSTQTLSEVFGNEVLSDEVGVQSKFLSELADIDEDLLAEVDLIKNSDVIMACQKTDTDLAFYVEGVTEVIDQLEIIKPDSIVIYFYLEEGIKPSWLLTLDKQDDGSYYDFLPLATFGEAKKLYYNVTMISSHGKYAMTETVPLDLGADEAAEPTEAPAEAPPAAEATAADEAAPTTDAA